MEKSEMERKILEEEDFINAPKYGNSLNKLLAKSENPCENNSIGRLLLITPEKVEEIYQESVEKLKEEMNPDEDSE